MISRCAPLLPRSCQAVKALLQQLCSSSRSLSSSCCKSWASCEGCTPLWGWMQGCISHSHFFYFFCFFMCFVPSPAELCIMTLIPSGPSLVLLLRFLMRVMWARRWLVALIGFKIRLHLKPMILHNAQRSHGKLCTQCHLLLTEATAH